MVQHLHFIYETVTARVDQEIIYQGTEHRTKHGAKEGAP